LELGHLLCDAIGCLRIGLDRQWWRLAKNQQQDADGECEGDPGENAKYTR
jgi:hypothetical protein